MSSQQSQLKPTSRRFPLRLVPEDKLTMERTLGLTVFNQKSAMVRAALGVFKQVWDAKSPNNRIVLRNNDSQRQYGVLITRASHELAEKDELFIESKLANKDEIFELRLSAGDINLLEELIDAGAAGTFSQAIRRALALYAHVVVKHGEGYRLAAQTPSGELLYLNVPGVRRIPTIADPETEKPLVFILDDNQDMWTFWMTNFEKEGAVTSLFQYDKSWGLQKNLTRALEWANKLAESTTPRKVGLVVDLCWAVRKDFTEDKEEWGIIPKGQEKEKKQEYVAGYAGLKFIEFLKDYSWAKEVPIFLVTKHVNEMEVRQGLMKNPDFKLRLKEFDERTKGLNIFRKFSNDREAPKRKVVREIYAQIAEAA